MAAGAILALTVIVALLAQMRTDPAHAQQAGPAGVTAQQSNPALKLLDANDAVILLLDHQTGLFQTVKDIPLQELRTNTAVLAKLATLAKIPMITTASEPGGPNGPLMTEIHEFAPSATYVARKGEISAWDNADFVKTVRATGKKTLIIAGVWTSVCVAFPAIQAKAVNVEVITLDQAPQGYRDFDQGTAKKFVIDPHGSLKTGT